MRKIITILSMLLIMESTSLKAQTSIPKFELDLSYGVLNVGEFVYAVGEILGTAITGGIEQFEDLDFSGAVSLEAYAKVGNRISVGGLFGAEAISAVQTINLNSEKTYYDYNATVIAAMPMIKLTYINRPHVGLYGKAGAGVLAIHDEDDDSLDGGFMFNLTPIGVDFGGERVRGFYELNIGTKGFFNFGVRFGF